MSVPLTALSTTNVHYALQVLYPLFIFTFRVNPFTHPFTHPIQPFDSFRNISSDSWYHFFRFTILIPIVTAGNSLDRYIVDKRLSTVKAFHGSLHP